MEGGFLYYVGVLDCNRHDGIEQLNFRFLFIIMHHQGDLKDPLRQGQGTRSLQGYDGKENPAAKMLQQFTMILQI